MKSNDYRQRGQKVSTLQSLALENHLATAKEDNLEDALNGKVDREVALLADGLQDIVKMASSADTHFQAAQNALQIKYKTEAMTQAVYNLLHLTHTLKLLYLFSDTQVPTEARHQMSVKLKDDIRKLKEELNATA